MINKSLLKAELILNQLNLSQLASSLNISKSSLSKKVNGKSEFLHSEIQAIGKLIGQEKVMQIFFANKVS